MIYPSSKTYLLWLGGSVDRDSMERHLSSHPTVAVHGMLDCEANGDDTSLTLSDKPHNPEMEQHDLLSEKFLSNCCNSQS